ncbi:MAG: pyridoxamine 5'-phosphate oxidase [Chloroflexi bacterium]|nr:MAG: pyridoxamine 5'-phosphate oxidase [Chloroflexota bacterium]
MTLATVGEDGVWATAVFYASIDFKLYFLSAPHTRHAQNFQHQKLIAATIQEDDQDWTSIKGIQVEGVVKKLSGTKRLKIINHYKKKFPFLATPHTQLITALAKVNWYELSPKRLYFIDNSKGFGYRAEVSL